MIVRSFPRPYLASRPNACAHSLASQSTLLVKEAKLKDIRRKVASLKELIKAEGVDASALFDKAGLTEELTVSTSIGNSRISDQEAAPTGPLISSTADSIKEKSGVSRESGDDELETVRDSAGSSGNRRSVGFVDQNGDHKQEQQNVSHYTGSGDDGGGPPEEVVGTAAATLAGPADFRPDRLEI